MFPSAEPFNYPNQPLTTFENNQFSKDQAVFNTFGAGRDTASSVIPPRQMNTSEGDNLEAQFYTLPPYMVAQQQQQHQQHQQQQTRHQQARWDVSMPSQMSGMPQLSTLGMDGNMLAGGDGWSGQQAGMAPNGGFTGVNLNEIFGGEEWNGVLMDQGFRN